MQNEDTEITDQSTDSVEEVEVARGIKIDYDVEYEQEIFGDASKDEIYEIIDDILKSFDDEDYENNIDSIIEEVFKDHGITDEDNLDFA